MSVPSLTRAQMIEVDRIMIEDLGIGLLQMMENAGRNLARLCLVRYRPASVLVLAGSGGNGGGGMVAARHLANLGVEVRVVATRPLDELTGVPRHQMATLVAMGVPIDLELPDEAHQDLIVDAVVGYSLSGPLHGRARYLVDWANRSPVPVLSLDAPSGLDLDDGYARGSVVAAEATMTLALPKAGLIGSPFVGVLHLADIGVPPSIYEHLGLEVPPGLFSQDSVVLI